MFALKRDQLAEHQSVVISANESQEISIEHRELRDFQHIMTILCGQALGIVEDEWDEEEYDDDFDPEYAL